MHDERVSDTPTMSAGERLDGDSVLGAAAALARKLSELEPRPLSLDRDTIVTVGTLAVAAGDRPERRNVVVVDRHGHSHGIMAHFSAVTAAARLIVGLQSDNAVRSVVRLPAPTADGRWTLEVASGAVSSEWAVMAPQCGDSHCLTADAAGLALADLDRADVAGDSLGRLLIWRFRELFEALARSQRVEPGDLLLAAEAAEQAIGLKRLARPAPG